MAVTQLQVMWNSYRSNCKLSKYILTPIMKHFISLVTHKKKKNYMLCEDIYNVDKYLFSLPYTMRWAITEMFITYRLSL